MTNQKNRLKIYFFSGFLFFLDQFFKYLAYSNQDKVFIWKNIVGWEFYANNGIAFSIPFPNLILLVFMPIIIFVLCAYYLKLKNKNTLQGFAIILIILGAVSNFVDRILFGITIDYLRFFTGVINLADIMIVLGVLLLLLKEKNMR